MPIEKMIEQNIYEYGNPIFSVTCFHYLMNNYESITNFIGRRGI